METDQRKKQEKLLIDELRSIEDVQKWIDRIAEDLHSNEYKYSILGAIELGRLLGLEVYDDVADWSRSFYCYKQLLDEDCSYDYPYASNIELIEGQIPEERFAELSAQSDKIFEQPGNEDQQDLALTSKEKELLNDAYAEEQAKDAFPNVTVVYEELVATNGDEIYFEAEVGDGGEVEAVYSPYDIENGEGFDDSDYVEIDWPVVNRNSQIFKCLHLPRIENI